jgi:hypothetical protein
MEVRKSFPGIRKDGKGTGRRRGLGGVGAWGKNLKI